MHWRSRTVDKLEKGLFQVDTDTSKISLDSIILSPSQCTNAQAVRARQRLDVTLDKLNSKVDISCMSWHCLTA